MAEFCKDCFMKLNGSDRHNIILSKDLDLCEGCGQMKRVVVELRPRTLLDEIRDRFVERRLAKGVSKYH